MAKNSDLIAKVCDVCGGAHTSFSQSQKEVKAQRQIPGFYNDKSQSFDDSTYIGGMCHPMSMYWLALRKKGEKNFFEWLCPKGVWDKGAINVLVVKTGMYKNGKNEFVPKSDMANFDDRFFGMYGLSRAPAKASGLDAVMSHLTNNQGYHMISLSRDGGGHAVAAHVTGDGAAAFFDPNYGEFAFSNRAMFGSFMKGFMKHSGYAGKYTRAQRVDTFR